MKEQKKWELLKYAYDNYPKGTIARFKCAEKVDHISTGKFKIEEDLDNGISVMSDNGINCFYTSRCTSTNEDKEEWATILTGKQPLLKSEDGVDLFEGDALWLCRATVLNINHCSWNLPLIKKTCVGILNSINADKERLKAFSTKQAALDFCEKMNKPKEVTVPLYFPNSRAVIKDDISEVHIYNELGLVCRLSTGDIKDIQQKLKK